MNINFRIILIIFLISIWSCNNISNKENTSSEKNIQDETDIRKTIKLNLKYSDTVFKKTYGYGEINHGNEISGIKISDIIEYYTILYVSINEEAKTFEDVKKTKQNDFIDTIGNGVFYYKYKFESIGKKELKLAFESLVVYVKDSINMDTISYVQESTPITLPVFVLDSSLIIGYKGDVVYFKGMKKYKFKRKDSARILKEAQQKIDSMKRVLNNQ